MNSASTLQFDVSPEWILAFGFPSGWEWIVILAIGLLIFGRRLPEVGRSVGKSIVEFKKGIKGIEQEIENESSEAKQSSQLKDDSPAAAHSAMYDKTAESTPKDS